MKRKEHDDVTERLALRKQLGCKTFKWYLDYIYPELEIPDDNYIATGEVRMKISLFFTKISINRVTDEVASATAILGLRMPSSK